MALAPGAASLAGEGFPGGRREGGKLNLLKESMRPAGDPRPDALWKWVDSAKILRFSAEEEAGLLLKLVPRSKLGADQDFHPAWEHQ